jgi:hypothetical protein
MVCQYEIVHDQPFAAAEIAPLLGLIGSNVMWTLPLSGGDIKRNEGGIIEIVKTANRMHRARFHGEGYTIAESSPGAGRNEGNNRGVGSLDCCSRSKENPTRRNMVGYR